MRKTVLSRLSAASRLATAGRYLLLHLKAHHDSQSKPHTTPVSKSWNEKLSGDLSEVIEMIDEVFGE